MDFIDTFLNPEILAAQWPLLLEGLGMTLLLAVVVFPLAAGLGLVIASLHVQHIRGLNPLLIAYVDFLRAFPPLVLLIFIYYALPMIGLEFGAFTAAALALTLNGSSYFAEIFRAGLESVPAGQTEAARSTGLNAFQTLRHVVIPQGVRNVAPDLASNTLELIKQTSIASVVSIQELLRAAQLGQSLTYSPTPLIAAALLYLLVLWPLVRLISRAHRVEIPR